MGLSAHRLLVGAGVCHLSFWRGLQREEEKRREEVEEEKEEE